MRVDPDPGRSSHAAPDIDRDVLDLVAKPHLSEPFIIFIGFVRMECGRIIRAKKKPPGGILEARTAIRCKYLASRRPPAAKQGKIGKAGSARNHPGLRASLKRPRVERMSIIAALIIDNPLSEAPCQRFGSIAQSKMPSFIDGGAAKPAVHNHPECAG